MTPDLPFFSSCRPNRTQTVDVVAQYQYQSKQSFLRAPFIVQFQGKRTGQWTQNTQKTQNTPLFFNNLSFQLNQGRSLKYYRNPFILVPLHTEPTQAIQEIDQLYDVFKEVSKKWNNTNVMFLGDFHAACAYVTRANRKNIRLFTNTSFSWLIKDKVDTTVSDDTNCAYDRIVVYGEPFLKAISPLSAKVYNIAKEFKLTRSKVLEVSDHFPVEVKLKSSALLLQATPLLILLVQSFPSAL
uniref:Uncharacterized protein n=1 Tax=Seriola lalandi dorsalis TaxID=1841481 RepID=A0A3B4XNK9_SERLL